MIYIYYRAGGEADGSRLCVVRVPGRRPIICERAEIHGASTAVVRDEGEVPRLWIETAFRVTVYTEEGVESLCYDAERGDVIPREVAL